MNKESMIEIWKWLWAVDNRPTYQVLEDGRLCVIYHRGDPYSIAEIKNTKADDPKIEAVYVGHFSQQYGLPCADDLIKDENKIDLSVENPLELMIKRAMDLSVKFLQHKLDH